MRVTVAAMLLSVSALPFSATVAAPPDKMHPHQDEPNLPAELRGNDWATLGKNDSIVIDVSNAPADFAETLAAIEDKLDGRTVAFEGFAVPSPNEARSQDAEEDRANTKTRPPNPCNALPSVDLETISSYSGCTARNGHQFSPVENSETDSSEVSMATALENSLMTFHGEITGGSQSPRMDTRPRVSIVDGTMTADFPRSLEDITVFNNVSGGLELWQRLQITAMTDPQVNGVELLIEGDCRAFALATGGDACPGAVSRKELTGRLIQ